MGKYQPLSDFLSDRQDDSWDASFAEIERILRFKLPPSARDHRAWWANQFRGHHSQAKAWIEAGWETRDIDQRRGRVRFERTTRPRRTEGSVSEHDLWAEAARVSGIGDRKALERAAVAALLQREAGRTLALMGGTMPDAVAPRARPFE
jgi:hypothetical protein